MPLVTDNPGIIDPDLIAACRAQIDTEFGPIPPGLSVNADDYREKLARCIARAAQYVRDNALVVKGQKVVVEVTGVATGSSTILAEGEVVTDGELA